MNYYDQDRCMFIIGDALKSSMQHPKNSMTLFSKQYTLFQEHDLCTHSVNPLKQKNLAYFFGFKSTLTRSPDRDKINEDFKCVDRQSFEQEQSKDRYKCKNRCIWNKLPVIKKIIDLPDI